jgi:sugar fermentation stimulation protein A
MILVPFTPQLEETRFIKREKRFLVHVNRCTGESEIVHCANSGSMKSCIISNCRAYILDSQNPERKLRHSLELLELEDGLACLNTARANQLVKAVLNTPSREIAGYNLFASDFKNVAAFRSEAPYNANTRFDFGFENGFIEVKSVSLRLNENTLAFPDAVTTRGQKHVRELAEVVRRGQKAFLFFVIMRAANQNPRHLASNFRTAREIDPDYAQLVSEASLCGVKMRILVADISTEGLGVRGYFEFTPAS